MPKVSNFLSQRKLLHSNVSPSNKSAVSKGPFLWIAFGRTGASVYTTGKSPLQSFVFYRATSYLNLIKNSLKPSRGHATAICAVWSAGGRENENVNRGRNGKLTASQKTQTQSTIAWAARLKRNKARRGFGVSVYMYLCVCVCLAPSVGFLRAAIFNLCKVNFNLFILSSSGTLLPLLCHNSVPSRFGARRKCSDAAGDNGLSEQFVCVCVSLCVCVGSYILTTFAGSQ